MKNARRSRKRERRAFRREKGASPGGVAEKAERIRPGFLQKKERFCKKSRIHTKNDRFVQIGMLDGFLKIVIP